MMDHLIAVLQLITISFLLATVFYRIQISKMDRKAQAATAMQLCGAHHTQNFLKLEILIHRYAHDHKHLPQSMDHMRGMNMHHDHFNPFSGKLANVNDLTGLKEMRVVLPHDLTFEFLSPDGSVPERCIIALIAGNGEPRCRSTIYA